MVQPLAGALGADGLGRQRGQLVPAAVVVLAPVHHGLEHQQQQDLQVVLRGEGSQASPAPQRPHPAHLPAALTWM